MQNRLSQMSVVAVLGAPLNVRVVLNPQDSTISRLQGPPWLCSDACPRVMSPSSH